MDTELKIKEKQKNGHKKIIMTDPDTKRFISVTFVLGCVLYLIRSLFVTKCCHVRGLCKRGRRSVKCPQRFWVLLLCLAVPYCIMLNLFPVPATMFWSKHAPHGSVYCIRWNVSEFATAEELKKTIVNGTAEPLLTLFSTWSDRADLQQVRNLTLRNWRQLAPYVRPVLFTNDSALAQEAQGYGWHTLPVSRSAVGVPVLKFLYMDAMKRFNSTLYAFTNGDILFTHSLVDSLLAILSNPRLPLDTRPLLVVGRRTNVANVTEPEAWNFESITRMAKARGKFFKTNAVDFFITIKQFPWSDIPGVVIGRAAYDNWLVFNAIENNYVVVDVSETALAVHQTTRAGNEEGHQHTNASYNDRLLTKLYKQIDYDRGRVDCAPWRTVQEKNGTILVEPRTNFIGRLHCVPAL